MAQDYQFRTRDQLHTEDVFSLSHGCTPRSARSKPGH